MQKEISMLSSDVGLTKEYLTATWFYLMTSQMPFGHSLPWKNSCAWSIRIRFLKTPLSVGILLLWFWSSVHFSQYLNYLFSNRLTLVPFLRFAATYQYNFSSSKPFISKKIKVTSPLPEYCNLSDFWHDNLLLYLSFLWLLTLTSFTLGWCIF